MPAFVKSLERIKSRTAVPLPSSPNVFTGFLSILARLYARKASLASLEMVSVSPFTTLATFCAVFFTAGAILFGGGGWKTYCC